MKPVLRLLLLTLAAFLGSLFASPEAEAVSWKTAPGDFFCGTLEDAGENGASAREQCRINGWLNYDTASGCTVAAKNTETVQRAMSRAELSATQSTGLLRGGRSGTHHVSDAVNSSAGRAQQRLALPQTPEVRVTIEVPGNTFSPPTRVQPNFNMPGGGMERTATGNIPVRILRVDDL